MVLWNNYCSINAKVLFSITLPQTAMRNILFLFVLLPFCSPAQYLVKITDQYWSLGAQTGPIVLADGFANFFENRGIAAALFGSYSWKQDNRRITNALLGLRFEQMQAYKIRPTLAGGGTTYFEKQQKALYLQVQVQRELPMGNFLYLPIGVSANLLLYDEHTGRTTFSSPFQFPVQTNFN
jgi:hypothetical protein